MKNDAPKRTFWLKCSVQLRSKAMKKKKKLLATLATFAGHYPTFILCYVGADIGCIVFGPCGVLQLIHLQMSQFGFTAGRKISRKTRDPGVHPHHFPNRSCLEFSGTAMRSLCWDSVAMRWQLDKYLTSRGPAKLSMMTKCLCKQQGRMFRCYFIKRFCLSYMHHRTELPTYWVVCMIDASISSRTATCVWVKSPEALYALNAFDFYSCWGFMQLSSWSHCISAPLSPSFSLWLWDSISKMLMAEKDPLMFQGCRGLCALRAESNWNRLFIYF